MLPGVMSVVAGGLLALSLPPRGWWPAGLAGFAMLARGFHEQPRHARLRHGAIAGVGLFVPGLWWATDLHAVGAIVLMASQAAFLAAAGLMVTPERPWSTVPAAVVLMEAVRWRWPLGGLPFASPVLGLVDAPWVLVAGLGGAFAVLFVGALAGAAIGGPHRRLRWGVLAGVVVATIIMGAVGPRSSQDADRTIEVAIVQGGGPRGRAAVQTDPNTAFERHLSASRRVPAGVDLLVWPENVIDVDGTFDGSDAVSLLRRALRPTNATAVVGVTETVQEDGGEVDRFRNAAVALGADGRILDRYEKALRVPFGEYIPLRGLMAEVVNLSRVPRDAVPGEGPAVLDTSVGQLGTIISFEGMFPRRGRSAIRAGGEVLVIPTNAASYRTDAVPAQQLAAARLRAMETDRAVLQAAPTGYSALIGASGELDTVSRLGTQEVLEGRVALRTTATPYVALGDGPVIVLATIVLVAARRPVRSVSRPTTKR